MIVRTSHSVQSVGFAEVIRTKLAHQAAKARVLGDRELGGLVVGDGRDRVDVYGRGPRGQRDLHAQSAR